jgi:hypothetical protein
MILLGSLPGNKNKGRGFAFVESELKDLDNSLATSRTNEYGRVDKTAAKFLLAQIYLNAKVYIGVDRFNEAATLSNEIITSSGYTFANVAYKDLFSADNNRNGSQSEFIFPIVSDGNQSYWCRNEFYYACLNRRKYGPCFTWYGRWMARLELVKI